MSEERKEKARWLRGCLFGCGGLVFIVVVLAVISVSLVLRGYGRAADDRETLERLYPSQAEYTPATGGRIDADRMRRFLEVRRVLMAHCEAVTADQAAFARMAKHGAEGSEPDGAILGDVWQAIRVMPRIGRDFGDYVGERNRALIEQEMGLGEYTWIYVVGYFAYLGHRPLLLMGESDKPKVFQGRVFPDVTEMIRRHAGSPVGGEEASGEHDRLASWRRELEALDSDPGRVPFEDGLPEELLHSLAGFRGELERLACPAASELDVVLTERRGFGFDHF